VFETHKLVPDCLSGSFVDRERRAPYYGELFQPAMLLSSEEQAMTQPDSYLLGRGAEEEARLKEQIASLAPDSDSHLEKVGIKFGERVVDVGCGPGGVLHLLGKRVGPSGSVLGIDRSPAFVDLARRFVADMGMTQIEVQEGDAYDTRLPRASFDGGHMRLVLVNVPKPELIVRELVSLVRPGGWVASFEPDFLAHVFDPPSPEYSRLLAVYKAFAAAQGIDLSVGRRTHRLFREAGLIDIDVDPIIHVYPVGHNRRHTIRSFINNVREKLIECGLIARDDLDGDLKAIEHQLADPEVLVTSGLYFRLRGRVAPLGAQERSAGGN
jgi:SAM-dependent methyltransferase